MITATDVHSYVFGIVPAGSRLPGPGTGLATRLRLVEFGELAAVVGTAPGDRPLGRAADLMEHDRVLSAIVANGTPLLPMRFGAVMTDDDAVAHDLLASNTDTFGDTLAEVGDRLQYTLKASYREDAVLREMVAVRPDVARAIRSGAGHAEADFDRRLRLGELIVRVFDEFRPIDAEALLAEIASNTRFALGPTSAPEDVLNAAFLVERADLGLFEERVEAAGRERRHRMRLRMTGPSPAYDFVGTE